ncbi:cytochrome c biogenesis protein CcdA [Clostridium sp. JN-9]|uniref:cytochrome c biogenesis CcdA family protein n=1 Tax=Clostridium sp. JN-9 TaxID=2507159 RepID=UPI000FFE3142|nr:cytochrome c biogenesis protein CcdA [Clostridium sp. JN-9]QAT39570.1 cytochrome c biogenesis protein CcdA [Clostridium sp. JN-9]
MDNISLILAFSAGLLSFLSPCVLPLFPAYIGYITGTTIGDTHNSKNKFNALYKSFAFVIGFSIIFILLGATATFLGSLVTKHMDILRKIGGIIIILFGLHTTGIFKIKFLYYEKKFIHFQSFSNLNSLFMGMAFATGWTPCIGPILASILIYASNMNTVPKGILLLIMYSLGLAVPFILTALAVEKLTLYFKKISKYLPVFSIVSGILMIAMGILIFTNKLSILSNYFNF